MTPGTKPCPVCGCGTFPSSLVESIKAIGSCEAHASNIDMELDAVQTFGMAADEHQSVQLQYDQPKGVFPRLTSVTPTWPCITIPTMIFRIDTPPH